MASPTSARQILTKMLYESWVNGTLQLKYTAGMQSYGESEALEGALPIAQNTPQKCPYGLYAEQINGTSFTTPRHYNLRSFLYKISPTVQRTSFEPLLSPYIVNDFSSSNRSIADTYCPNVQRWNPQQIDTDSCEKTKFYQGLRTLCGAGDTSTKTGMSIYLYAFNENMLDTSFCNADGDILIVPQNRTLLIRTEFGCMEVPPKFIAVIQRGIHFSVMYNPNEQSQSDDDDQFARGYIAEIYEGHFAIPELGPIGSAGLANCRDFETVTASFEHDDSIKDYGYRVVHKFGGKLYECERNEASIYDVVAWHGNYAPYRYDLSKFCAVFSVSYDHTDPSVLTVLTAQSLDPGVAVCDFVIFPPRWQVMQNTFRPPYYHRNVMSEFVGNIHGDIKDTSFIGGTSQVHPVFTPHGVPSDVANKLIHEVSPEDNNKPMPPKYTDLEFMFESKYNWKFTTWSQEADNGASTKGLLQADFLKGRYDTFRHSFDPKSK
eukprot:CAMPEP_0197029846 /NCGR_PEP_ID=MMETSP1384-20130603/9208_1 /TAXON_ID=29189 /ORGANISM="Ammonia sp." /LENGTH=489 /DNA_ID=CAMNT_0042459085 /DNA_START=118 /DNA_END=1587 /DNA_ORIENTATION=+